LWNDLDMDDRDRTELSSSPDHTWKAPLVSGPLIFPFLMIILGAIGTATAVGDRGASAFVWVGAIFMVGGFGVLGMEFFICARWVEHFPDGRLRFRSLSRSLTFSPGEIRSVRRIPVLFDAYTLLPLMVCGTGGRILLFPRMSEVRTMISTILEENPNSRVAKIWPGRI
jgi:hypothetical protein